MSKQIYNELVTIEEKLGDIQNGILASKRAIAYALKYAGITTVHPYTDNDQEYGTYKYYADLIKTLANQNAMMLEYTIAEGTAYKRTVVLPIYFGNSTSGYDASGATLNDIADEIVVANKEADTLRLAKTDVGPVVVTPMEDSGENHLVTDPFGNVCTDGDYIPTMEEIETYLDEDQQEEMLSVMESLGIEPSEPKVLSTANGVYDYIVDWGDGSAATFVDGGDYETNKAAIWHTYENPGTYDVSISGVFKTVSSTRYYNGTNISTVRTTSNNPDMPFIDGYPVDNDGVQMRNDVNYASTYSLVRVLAWGNTQLTNMQYAFTLCRALTEIPMYNTTNSFDEVTNFSYIFANCSALKSLPYNSNTQTGLFSNCTNATTFAYAFAYCTGIEEAIPNNFIDGCYNVTSVAYMFAYSHLHGSLPTGLFSGMTGITTAECTFASSSGYSVIEGELSEDLFHDCDGITSLYRTFYNCDKITGRITQNMFGKLKGLTTMRQCFYNCSGITGIDPDAFHDLSYSSTSAGLNCRHAFYGCTGITEIPKGLLEGLSESELAYTDESGETKYWNDGNAFTALSGTGLQLENMFEACTGLTTIASTALTNLKVANARGMFGGCTGLTCELPIDPNCGDWNSYDTIQKWYGAFGNCRNMSNASAIPFELGGQGSRIYSDGQVGKICVSNNGTYTLYEPTAYYSGSKLVDGTPVGIVYADVYLDKSYCIPTLSSGFNRASTNSADSDTIEANKLHKLFIGALNDTTKTWVDAQSHAEDITTITNTTNYNGGYDYFYWSNSTTQSKQYQRYNGEAYTRALNQFVVNMGYSDIGDATLPRGFSNYKVVSDTTSSSYQDFVISALPDASSADTETLYFAMDDDATCKYCAYYVTSGTWVNYSDYDYIVNSTRYPAVSYANTYNTTIQYFNPGDCFLPDGADLWDQFCMRDWFNDIITNFIIASGTHTSSTARCMRTGTYYWTSAEYSSTNAWHCNTNIAYLSNSSKWNSYYVRPSLALTIN